MNSVKPLLRDLPLTELTALVTDAGHAAYRSRQLMRWLYRSELVSWEEMGNLPGELRRQLQESHQLRGLRLAESEISRDGSRKFLFSLRDRSLIESVMIPMAKHTTFCLSSQVGCAMACRFCATARGGLSRQLSRGEIVEQIFHLQRDLATSPFPDHGDRQFNVVLMGMGEPLDNWSEVAGALETMTSPSGCGISVRRVTVSTSGSRNGLKPLMSLGPKVGLTVSVCGATARLRRRLMPLAGKAPLPALLDQAAAYSRRIRRRVTLAYIMIRDLTDTPDEAAELVSLVRRKPFKINLIPLNRLDAGDLKAPPPDRVDRFLRLLTEAGVTATVRISGGQDISAACGQLRQRRGDMNGAEQS